MPIYEYKCKNGHLFEVVQSMADDQITECEVCGAPVQRVFSPVAVHFKGSGFYTTDYGSKKKGASSDGGGKEEKSSSSDKKEPAKAKSDNSGSSSSDSGSSSSSSSD